ncbi:hypothetical protein I3843_15G087600 [Carya illinoinensis]|nr:hypothetical protein I3843_15G087600 [Carya illinoinensis]
MFLFLLLVFVIGFGVGALTIVGAEAVGVYFIIEWLNQKTKQKEAQIASRSQESSRDLDHSQSLDFALNKQGVVWLLESEKIPKNWLDKGPKEQKRKNDFLEVFPVKKHAKIKDQKLILAESDGSNTVIELKGCMIEAVSATSLSSRKWAKRFPLKLESKTSMINNGSKILYIYLETSWEKESWCKALRLASCDKKERVDWFFKLHEGFHNYLTTLNPGYPSFMKPSMGLCAEPADQMNRSDGTSSKVRFLWKKIAKKTSRVGLENRSSWAQLSGLAERKPTEKTRIFQELVSASASMKRSKSEENLVQQSPSTLSHSGSQSHSSGISDVDSDDRLGNDEGTLFFSKKNDEGTLCWNLFISRLFFDVKSNAEIKRSIQAWVQRTLSSTRTPSYIGELICTAIDLGNLPPYIHGVRIVPMDMNEVWAFEVDIEYSGGVVLDIETRLEVRELDFQKGIVDSDPGSSSVGEISSDLLEGFEYFRRQLNSTGGIADAPESKEKDGLKSCKNTTSASTSGSRWKSILNSIVKQVSQVPLSLAIRVASLRGTLQLHIKPPPSDQLWFAFTSMPDIGFNLESSIGEHKISSGRVASFLISRFKFLSSLCLPSSSVWFGCSSAARDGLKLFLASFRHHLWYWTPGVNSPEVFVGTRPHCRHHQPSEGVSVASLGTLGCRHLSWKLWYFQTVKASAFPG